MASPQERLKILLTSGKPATLALAESCTGGLVAAKVTSQAGSSAYFDRGVVTYSNQAKVELLGVDPKVLDEFGAVSREVATAMVEGLFNRTGANIVGAVTGIAGPDGGTPQKPVGTVWLAWALRGGELRTEVYHFAGDREAVREQSADALLNHLCEAAGERGQ